MDFKERAIYQLPNGRELFAHVSRQQKPTLYNLSATESGEYSFDADGRILFNGQLTAWDINDLIDTGRLAPPDVTGILLRAVGTPRNSEQQH